LKLKPVANEEYQFQSEFASGNGWQWLLGLVPASAHPPTTSIDSSTFPPVLQRLKFKGYTVWHYIAWLSESLCRMAFNHGTLTVTLE